MKKNLLLASLALAISFASVSSHAIKIEKVENTTSIKKEETSLEEKRLAIETQRIYIKSLDENILRHQDVNKKLSEEVREIQSNKNLSAKDLDKHMKDLFTKINDNLETIVVLERTLRNANDKMKTF